VEAVTGTEQMNADHPLPQHSHRVTIRNRTKDVRHDWRGTWNGVVLNVVTVPPPDTGDVWQVVLCQEKAQTTEDE
jgi:head-tail adaptor